MASSQPRIPIVSSFDDRGVREAESAFGKLGNAAKTVAKTVGILGAAVAGASLVIGKKAVDAASDLSESINAVNVTFGEAAEGILGLSEASARAVGLSSREFNAFAVQFGAFSKQIAGAEGDVIAVTEELTTRIADFASVMNLDVPEAAQVFQSSLAGETEPIRRFGIDLSAAAVELFALESGLVASKDEMTEAIKVQARYGLLMQSTAQMAGDFANTSDGLANQQRILAAEFDNAQARLGMFLLPAMEAFVGVLLSDGIPALNGFIDWLGPKLEPAAEAFARVVSTARERIIELVGSLRETSNVIRDRFNREVEKATGFVKEYEDELVVAAGAVAGITTALVAYQTATAAARGVTVALTAAQVALNVAMSANPVGIVVVAIAALIGALVAAYFRFESFRNIVDQVFDVIQVVAGVVWEFVQGAWASLVDAFQTVMPYIWATIDVLAVTFVETWATVSEAVSSFFDRFVEIMAPVAGWFNDNVVSTVEAALGFFVELFRTAFDTVQGAVDVLLPVFTFLVDAVREAFDLMVPIVRGALEIIGQVIRVFIDTVGPIFSLLWDGLTTVVKVAFEVIENTVEIALAVVRGLFNAGKALLQGDFGAIWDALKGIVADSMSAISDLVGSSFDAIVEFIGEVPARILDFAGRFLSNLVTLGKDIVTKIVEGILAAPGAITDAITDLIPGAGTLGKIGGGILSGIGSIIPFAEGGIVNQPTIGLVGEAGPEAIIPLSSARAPQQLGGTVNVTVNAGIGTDGTQVGRQIVQVLNEYAAAGGARLSSSLVGS
jgi:phage-related protein